MTATYTKSKHRLLYKKINELGIEHFKIELVDEITCEDKRDLHALEGYYILQYGTLNHNLAGRTKNADLLRDLVHVVKTIL